MTKYTVDVTPEGGEKTTVTVNTGAKANAAGTGAKPGTGANATVVNRSARLPNNQTVSTQQVVAEPAPVAKKNNTKELHKTAKDLLRSYNINPDDFSIPAVKRMRAAIHNVKGQEDIDLIRTKLGYIIAQHSTDPNKGVYDSLLLQLTKEGTTDEFPNLLEALEPVSLVNQMGGLKALHKRKRTHRKTLRKHHTLRKHSARGKKSRKQRK